MDTNHIHPILSQHKRSVTKHIDKLLTISQLYFILKEVYVMKKIFSSLLISALILSISSICVYGLTVPDGSLRCTISTNQSSSYSDYVIGTDKYFGGQNYSDSSHKLTVSSQCFSPQSGWIFDQKIAVNPGMEFSQRRTTKYAAAVSWRVHLAPYGIYSSGCRGLGYIWHT